MRAGPTASLSRSLCACGSHLTQSQSRAASSSARTATTRPCGAWNAVASQTSDRARARTCSTEPSSSTRLNADRSMAAGRSGCARWTDSSRCSADAHTGSTWSIEVVVGGTSSSASGWVDVP